MNVHPDSASLRDLDALGPERRDEVLDHVAACSRCRDMFMASDPTRVFALLGRRPIPEDVLEDISASVMAGIEAGEPVPANRFAPGKAWAWSAWAAAVILGVALVLVPVKKTPGPETPEVVAEFHARPRATVTVINSPGEARVIDLAIGETQVVMIFDREMDL